MRYELSEQQYATLWRKYNVSSIVEDIPLRLTFWNNNLKSKFKLRYVENNTIELDENGYEVDDHPYGWHGIILGKEKNINFFLLQL